MYRHLFSRSAVRRFFGTPPRFMFLCGMVHAQDYSLGAPRIYFGEAKNNIKRSCCPRFQSSLHSTNNQPTKHQSTKLPSNSQSLPFRPTSKYSYIHQPWPSSSLPRTSQPLPLSLLPPLLLPLLDRRCKSNAQQAR